MKLYDEEELRKKNEKSKNVKKIILVSIIFTAILIVLTIVSIYYLIYNPNKITITVDGQESENIENMIIKKTTDDGDEAIFFPIRKVADEFGYKSSNGDYGTNVENLENCYVESDNEVVIFTQDSTTLYTIDKTVENNNVEYEELIIDTPVIRIDDSLYIDSYGFAKAFNVNIRIDNKKKKISITTLDRFIESAEEKVLDSELGSLDERFVNQKAILDNMMIISSDYDGQKGVINYSTKEEILGYQYDDITYIPTKKIFMVEKNGKVGIIDRDGVVRVKLQYDNLTLIDNENGLYLAENNSRFGVIDEEGNIKIYIEYSKIGVDISEYADNGLKSGYILLGKIIPVQRYDGKWIFFSINSQKNQDGSNSVQCTRIENGDFDSIGCISNVIRGNTSNLIAIKDYNVIVVQKYNRYGFMDLQGRVAPGLVYSDTFIETTSGKTNYYAIDLNGNQIQVIEELKKRGYNKTN